MTTTRVQPRRKWIDLTRHLPASGTGRTLFRGWTIIASERTLSVLVFMFAALFVLVADITLLALHPGTYRVDVGNYRDRFFLQNAHFQEYADGETYRWTRDTSTLWFTQVDVAPHTLLTLNLGGRPAAVEVNLSLNAQPWVELTAQTDPRHYTLLLPSVASGDVFIDVQSDTFTPVADERNLGVKIESFALTVPASGVPLPTLAQYLAQLVVLLSLQMTAIRLGWRWRWQALISGGLALALALILSQMLLLAYVYTLRLAIGGGVLALLTWGLLPIAERHLAWMGGQREIRLLWAIMLLACVIRFVGVFYPTFDAQDLGRNVRRLEMSIRGELVIIGWSGEFADGDTIYPPGPYLTLMPGLTLTNDRGTLLQGSLALMDGTTAFLVAMLAWRLVRQREVARMAMILYASNIAVFGAMTYGFAAQVFGQWFTAPLALLLLAPGALRRPHAWGLAILALLFGVLSHIGVAILGITWVGIMLGLLFLFGQRDRNLWWSIGLFIGSVLLAFVLLYVHIFETTVTHLTGSVVPEHRGFELRGNTPLLWKGMRLAYSVIGLLLLPFGLAWIVRAQPVFERLVVPLAWTLTALLYFTVDLVSALQVRYFYFSLPLAVVAIALVPGYLAERGRWGRVVAWALVLALAIPNILLWYSVTMADGKISMTPLTH